MKGDMDEKYKLEHIEELSFELCKPLYTTNRIKVKSHIYMYSAILEKMCAIFHF